MSDSTTRAQMDDLLARTVALQNLMDDRRDMIAALLRWRKTYDRMRDRCLSNGSKDAWLRSMDREALSVHRLTYLSILKNRSVS